MEPTPEATKLSGGRKRRTKMKAALEAAGNGLDQHPLFTRNPSDTAQKTNPPDTHNSATLSARKPSNAQSVVTFILQKAVNEAERLIKNGQTQAATAILNHAEHTAQLINDPPRG